MLMLSCDEVPASPLPATGRVAKCETVAARHRQIANQRKDFHHKTARHLVQSYDVVVVEDLAIANMVRRGQTRRRSRQSRAVPGQRCPGEVQAEST